MAKRLGRRIFLHSLGGATLALPFMPSLLPRELAAQPAASPKRFFGLLSYSGQFVTEFFPAWTPPGYQLRNAIYAGARRDGTTALHETLPGTRFKRARLSDFAERGVSNVLTTALNPYLEKMSLLRGIDLLQGSTSHSFGSFYGNAPGDGRLDVFTSRGLGQLPTIDQVLAHSDRFYPIAPRMRSLVMSTGSTSAASYTDYGMGGAVEQVSAYIEPRAIWEDLFAGFMSPDMPRENPNRLLMNAVHEDYARLRGHRRLSNDDRLTLDRHIEFLADIERELGATIPASCVVPAEPEDFGVMWPWHEIGDVDRFRRRVSLLIDMAVAAIRCDMTRVVNLSVQSAISDFGGTVAAHYHESDDVAGDWHDYAHDAAADPNDAARLTSINRWIATDVFAQICARLDVEEADGRTYLDNSLVCWGDELSLDHYSAALPTLLAGSAGGALETGYYVDYQHLDGDYANPIAPWGTLIPGVPLNRLLVTILQAMGLSPADYERGGRPGYGHIEVFDVAYNWPTDAYDMAQIGSPLPGIWLGS
jgi:hypothetical protein